MGLNFARASVCCDVFDECAEAVDQVYQNDLDTKHAIRERLGEHAEQGSTTAYHPGTLHALLDEARRTREATSSVAPASVVNASVPLDTDVHIPAETSAAIAAAVAVGKSVRQGQNSTRSPIDGDDERDDHADDGSNVTSDGNQHDREEVTPATTAEGAVVVAAATEEKEGEEVDREEDNQRGEEQEE